VSIAPERIAWLTSARDQAAVDLLQDIIQADIQPTVVVCAPHANAPEASNYVESVQRLCAHSDVEYVHLPPAHVKTIADATGATGDSARDEDLRQKDEKEHQRRVHDGCVVQHVQKHGCRIVVLAGYMRIVTHILRSHAPILNLHPAPPLGPIGTWQDVTWTLISVRARLAGAMLHIATKNLDRGPVVSYYTVPLDDDELAPLWFDFAEKLRTKSLQQIALEEGEREPLFKRIRERQFVREAPLLVVTLRRLLNRTLQIVHPSKGEVLLDGTLFPHGVCLNEEVEAVVRGMG
jgi:phosphoribosylglycinamide formyltransferase 1